ncbi:MAG: hypothetical protein G01um10147_1051 [Microgenomates group bacterium Gr01-1014_7]|nr:MAG: hypothetical protein G01um10147_1051 [Microgenomates group bacterium Gr01-1014_7]
MKNKFLKSILIILIPVFLVVLINSFSKSINNCRGLNSKSEKLICWEKLIDSTLQKGGIDQAFEKVEELYQSDPVFVGNCHSFVHLIGEKAYKLFSDKAQFNLSSKTSYCGYGFYHAFMESLLNDDGDLVRARKFCDYVEEKLRKQNADAKGACYHGIGHGVADNHDQKFWDNELDLVEQPLKLCEKVSPDETFLNRCSSGVFNVLAIAYNGNKLKINSEDPLWFCRQLDNNIYRKTCYEEMNTALFALSDKKILPAAKFLEEIEEDEFALSGIRSLAGVFGMSAVQKGNFEKFTLDCRKLQPRLRLACIKGFASGLIEGGSPELEYEKALKFCEVNTNIEERQACFDEVLRLSSVYYTSEKHKMVCNLVLVKFRRHCL